MNKKNLIIGGIIVVLLVVTFIWGGSFPKDNPNVDTQVNGENLETMAPITSTPEASEEPVKTSTNQPGKTADATATPKATGNIATQKPKDVDSESTPIPSKNPPPQEPQNVDITDEKLKATITVSCKELLNNMELLPNEKKELVPSNGIILSSRTVTFNEGESVFNVLQRELKRNKIHFEFVNTPMFNSSYIEGINNIYEFDCGELSGWIYKVNGWYPNYGSSRYMLKDGDVIEWEYTCDKFLGGQKEN